MCSYSAGIKSDKPFATSIEPGQPENPCSLTSLYTVGWPTSKSYLDIAKIYN